MPTRRRPTAAALLLLLSCAPLTHGQPVASETARPVDTEPAPLFVELETGLDFVHYNGMSGRYTIVEVTGSGGALFDLEGDGDLDLYLVQGRPLVPEEMDRAPFPPRHPLPLTDRLYRNDLTIDAEGRRTIRFVDVTEASGIVAPAFGMGVVTGDVDGDGFVDLYVTNVGANQLWRNKGDGTFEDITARAGVGESRWSVAGSFFDFDRDGDLDLYAGNYLDFSLARQSACTSANGSRDYCGPLSYPMLTDRLWRNRGDGTFEDVTRRAGLGDSPAATLGAIAADFDDDGRVDLYVANDMSPNQLWLNQGPGEDGVVRFVDDALLLGAAVNADGQAEASMGIDADDFDGDGDRDLVMTHLVRESNTLYVNEGAGLFRDRTAQAGLDTPSWDFTSFGAGFLDYDLDGDLDLAVVSGSIYTLYHLKQAGDPYPLHQPNQLFELRGDGTYRDVSARAGSAFTRSEVSRGLLIGDLDNDGGTDLVVTNNYGPARVLHNVVPNRGHWLGLRLAIPSTGGGPPRDALGASARLVRAEGPSLRRWVRTDGSYASARDPRLRIGLGTHTGPQTVEVCWPTGGCERFDGVVPDRYTTLLRGQGKAVTARGATP